ncbi:MAG: flgL [Solirubrobacterales bacterium]|nr:flgL [Solirubrobacterales bacterium]
MAMRITSQTMSTRVMDDLRAAQARVARQQQEVASGRRIVQASDDALGTHDALLLRGSLDGLTKDRESVADATAWVSATDSALSQITDVVHRARELTLQGANGATTNAGRAAIAAELTQLIDVVKDAANAKVGDAYIFGGTATSTPPYAAGAVDSYAGDTAVVARSIGPGVAVQVNTTGMQVLGAGGGDGQLLDTLRTIQAHLTANATASLQGTDLQALSANLDTITAQQATVGATQNRLDAADARLTDAQLVATTLLGTTQDADPVEALMQLNAQSAAYQGALKTAANVLQPSLLDFLR